jgi:hypothetical protein
MLKIYTVFFITFLLICSIALGVKGQDLNSLDQKRGFKDIQIGDSIQRYTPFFKYTEKATDGYDIFSIRNENPEAVRRYAQLGYIPIQQLNLLVYKSKIQEIRIFFAIETYEDLKNILMKAYGEPNDTPCETIESEEMGKRSDCRWKGQKIDLWLSGIDVPEKQKVVVGFSDFQMVMKMRKELTAAAVKDL